MPCKHEGGTEACIRFPSGACKTKQYQGASRYRQENKKAYQRYQLVWRKQNKRRIAEVVKRYNEANFVGCSNFTGNDSGKTTAACELFVRADLSKRGFEVTVPVSPTAVHDLHVELPSVGWRGVQVKAGRLNTKTGCISWVRGVYRGCSPILALVHLPTNRIKYQSGTEPLPPELQ